MHAPIELEVDVTDAAALGMPAQTAATVFLPAADELSDPPVVCFAFPGGGYSRRYYSVDMPGDSGGEAVWHVQRGWIFVACDSLGFGDATAPEGNVLTYDNIALGNEATVQAVMTKLESGSLLESYPSVRGATTLGLGQSMGGCFTIVLQGQHHTFDGMASLGFSAIHTVVPNPPGAPPAVWPWMVRGSDLAAPMIVNGAALAAAAANSTVAERVAEAGSAAEHPFAWAFHYDDVPRELVATDMAAGLGGPDDVLPPWRSRSIPSCGNYMLAPGTVATEAAAITVPVLLAMGERDVVPDPWLEPKAFQSATDITLYVCPRMAHMHNFASTRERFWARLHSWGNGVAQARTG